MKSKNSAKISLAICILCTVLLAVMICTFPMFIRWMYFSYHDMHNETIYQEQIFHALIPAFYCCVPFAACSLYMLIRILMNILHGNIFTVKNVKYFRWISWCCYAVTLITFGFSVRYMPIFVIGAATGIVGTLLRVVKNLMQSATQMREENDLTI
ncbi:MAG: DUF2975 domain-containing protein [Oscillospiraceae bacterium]|nr:DUF2975 domain-containing protein [Oscillospiraceae bacterium]